MFETLELQYLNKLVKGKVRDFPSPKTFHAIKVQCLGHNRIEPFTHVCGQFIVPIFTLVCDMSIQPRQRSDSTPPITRTFLFPTECLVECSEFVQGVFQELRRVYFFACVQRQIGIQTKIYPYALTCSRIGFGRGIVSDDIKPIGANCIAKDLDISDISVPGTVLVKRKPTLLKLKGVRGFVPRFERDSNTSFFYEVSRLKLGRTVAVFAFELRQSAKPVKKSVIRDVDTDNHLVKACRVVSMPSVFLYASTTCSSGVVSDTVPHTDRSGDNIAAPKQGSGYAHRPSRQAYCLYACFVGVRVSDTYASYACIFVFAFVFSSTFTYHAFIPYNVGGKHVAERLRVVCLPT